ncbi:MAG: LPPG:FO 2-phospho-L-lactate transferase [Anaerolineaceae bacterium]|nr:MAG: LPPG:FO 2-phospho-L-lactate transferase [Anaerolineaceae bacterium]
MNIVALAGGVGGAKLADGLAQLLPPEALTIIVNTGDDFEHLGLTISPDVDTVCYTLAGLANPETGWGRADETFEALENVRALGGPDWFRLGDKDLATHLERTRRLKAGQTLTQITRDFCQAWGVRHTILPMSDDPVQTMVDTVEFGELPFQEYFVRRKCEPKVKGFRFAGIESARPTPEVREALERADAIVICPSNPWVSIDPILAVLQLRSTVHCPPSIIAVSPIIGGQTVKGPAAKMYAEMGITPSALAIAEHYKNLLTGFILDTTDAHLAKDVQPVNVQTCVTNSLMKSQTDRRRLAQDVLNFIQTL